MLTQLRNHMESHIRDGVIDIWYDEYMEVGVKWEDQIFDAIARARVAVLLVSPHFAAAPYIHARELPRIRAAAEQGLLKILWLPLRPVDIEPLGIGEYQALADPSNPLSGRTEHQVDEALVKACKAIIKAVKT